MVLLIKNSINKRKNLHRFIASMILLSSVNQTLYETLYLILKSLTTAQFSSTLSCQSALLVKGKGKGKAEHLYSALHGTNHFKALRHGSHSF